MSDGIRIIENALPLSMIEEIMRCASEQTHVRTNHTSWRQEVIGLSGPIYIADMSGELKEKIHKHMATLAPDWSLENFDIIASYNTGGRYSFIPWHDDGNHAFSVTVYLNQVWDRDWAGYFMYERNGSEDIAAILPSFNRAVLFRTPLLHSVSMPNVNAPLRCTLQVFFKEKKCN
jgi:Rps23 Pro-64 3,4-dihydroxylase Tpa1-like proline 4-hydroxylase